MTKTWNIPVKFEVYGTVAIEAEHLDEAVKFVDKNIKDLAVPEKKFFIRGTMERVKKRSILPLEQI